MDATGSRPGERSQIEAAAGAVLASSTLIAGGHPAVVADARALLHAHVLDAPGLDDVRRLAARTDLRAALDRLARAHPEMPFVARASSELALALEIARPRESPSLSGARRAVEAVGRAGDAPAPWLGASFAACYLLAGSLAAPALGWWYGHADPDRWNYRGVWGAHDTLNMTSRAAPRGEARSLIVGAVRRCQRLPHSRASAAPMTSLLPCSHCHRHVRSTEATCPFCGHELGDLSAMRVAPDPPRRMGRAELFAFTTAFLGACQTGAAAPDVPAPVDVNVVRAIDAGAADVSAPPGDAGAPAVTDAAVLSCDVAVATDASRPRRVRRPGRPRIEPSLPQPCYGVPFVD